MTPTSSPYTVMYLQHFIYYALDNNILPTALFLAERLHAHEPASPDASHLLSLCYLRLDLLASAVECSETFARKGQHLGCAYIFAQCCKALGRFQDGITALEPWRTLKTNHWNRHSKTHRQSSPDAAAVLFLLGQLYQEHKETQKAVEAYAQASKLNPFIWDIFTNLCDIGAKIQVEHIFEPTQEMIASLSDPPTLEVEPLSTAHSRRINSLPPHASVHVGKSAPPSDPFNTSNRHNIQAGREDFNFPSRINRSNSDISSLTSTNVSSLITKIDETPNISSVPQDSNPNVIRGLWGIHSTANLEVAQAPTKQKFTSGLGARQPVFGKSSRKMNLEEGDVTANEPTDTSVIAATIIDRKRTLSGEPVQRRNVTESTIVPTRRSTRLLGQLQTVNKQGTITTLASKERREPKQPKQAVSRRVVTSLSTREMTDNKKHSGRSEYASQSAYSSHADENEYKTSKPSGFESQRRLESLYSLSNLLKLLGGGYYHLTQFQCQAALDMFYSIPATQRETSWVLSKIGRAHFEISAFKDAAKAFSKLRDISPGNVEDMDIYSTALWHLKQEVDLAFLSHELITMNRLSPEAWCAIGNSFSLQKDHASAVKCFKRATQIDPTFAYAFSLEGHEHVMNEEFDKAIPAYQTGIAAERRHYNSWYGLGRVYQKLGKYDKAERYFRIALKINPANPILIGCIGLILEQKGQPGNAMKYYKKACAISPNSIFIRERITGILLRKRDIHRALVELAVLKDLTPSRAEVYILIGRLHAMNHEKGLALQNFTVALGLNPLANSAIREEVEALEQDIGDDKDINRGIL